ncbi:MAG TPA: SOS response-associated peptidase [Chryseosolibacter sp.]|nr:SOS response-associated peptidase [Chryseosolibacter sp.]
MIDRYSITASADQLAGRFSVDVPDFYKAHYNASPTHILPVITSATPQGLSSFYWGTAPAWAKNKSVSEKIINLHSEDFAEKVSLRKALKKQRCIVPADGFYGWKKVGKRTSIPYRFVMKSQRMFAFPGLWEEFEDSDGVQIQTFAIITCAADGTVTPVQERMPVILTRASEKVWLDKESSEESLLEVIASSDTKEINFYPVSPRIREQDVDVPSLIVPTPPSDQHGNLTLFD